MNCYKGVVKWRTWKYLERRNFWESNCVRTRDESVYRSPREKMRETRKNDEMLMENARRIRPGRRGNLTSTTRSAARKTCTFALCRAYGLAMVSYLVSSIHPHCHDRYKTLKIARIGGPGAPVIGTRRQAQVRRRHTIFSPFRYGGVALFRAVA